MLFFLVWVGLIEARQILSQEVGPQWALAIVIAALTAAGVVLFVGPLMHAFSPYVRSKTAGYTYSFVEQHWHLAEDGSRTITVTRDFVFHREPQEEELCDILFGSLGLTIETLGYSSPDATIDRIDQTRPDTIRVFWRPSAGSIGIGQVYRHVCSWRYPKGETPYEKYFTVASRVHINDVQLRITTDRPIRDVEIRKDKGETKFWENLRIAALRTPSYVGLIERRDEKLLIVRKRGLKPGETYFVYVYL